MNETWRKSSDGLVLTVPRTGVPLQVLASEATALRRFGVGKPDLEKAKVDSRKVRITAIAKPLTFKPGQRQPDNLADFLKWAASVSFELDQRLIAALKKQPPDNMLTFIAAPNGVVGIVAKVPGHLRRAMQRDDFLAYLIDHHAAEIPIVRIRGDRADPDFVYRRNIGNQPNLSDKTVAIIGLGTIGSALAKLLLQSGAGLGQGKLLLLDTQSLAPGNVGRHLLPLGYVGEGKAFACAEALKASYADNRIAAVDGNALDHLGELADYDLVIDAAGDEALSEELNLHFQALLSQKRHCPVRLHVWLEGRGVAARALMIDERGRACFRCLRDLSGSVRYRVVRRGHDATLTPADCGEGAYFAYGPGAPAIAAGLATQVALDWIAGNPAPRFRTIRVVQSATDSVKDQDPQRLDGCPACADP